LSESSLALAAAKQSSTERAAELKTATRDAAQAREASELQVIDLNAALNKATRQAEALQKTSSSSQTAADEQQSSVQKKLARQESATASAEMRAEKLQSELSALRKQHAELKTQLEVVQRAKTAIEKDLKQQQAKQSASANQLHSSAAKVAKAQEQSQNEAQKLKSQVSDLEAKNAEMLEAGKKLKKQLATATDELQTAKRSGAASLMKGDQASTSLRQSLVELKADCARHEQAAATAQDKVSRLHAANSELQAELDQLGPVGPDMRLVDQLKAQLAQARRHSSSSVQASKEGSVALKRQLREARDALAFSEEVKRKLIAEMKDGRSIRQKQGEQFKEMETHLKNLRRDVKGKSKAALEKQRSGEQSSEVLRAAVDKASRAEIAAEAALRDLEEARRSGERKIRRLRVELDAKSEHAKQADGMIQDLKAELKRQDGTSSKAELGKLVRDKRKVEAALSDFKRQAAAESKRLQGELDVRQSGSSEKLVLARRDAEAAKARSREHKRRAQDAAQQLSEERARMATERSRLQAEISQGAAQPAAAALVAEAAEPAPAAPSVGGLSDKQVLVQMIRLRERYPVFGAYIEGNSALQGDLLACVRGRSLPKLTASPLSLGPVPLLTNEPRKAKLRKVKGKVKKSSPAKAGGGTAPTSLGN